MGNTDIARALGRLRDGDWDGAHVLVQNIETPDAAWIHAHLHRIEGDLGNAAYWYRRAGRPAATGTIEDERAEIMKALSL